MQDLPAFRGLSQTGNHVLHAAMLSAVFAFAAQSGVFSAEIELATDAPQALSPEQSRRLFQLPPGFHVELVASEPHVMDPVAMAFDARGRIFVCEIHGYNLEGYLDILELNKTGQLDTQVRRVPANPDATSRAAEDQYGTVKVLEDTDGDGVMDRSHVLADRLPPCYGVVPARDGVIVFCAPDIVYLADLDGDGSAEVRETLFAGFGVGEMWTRINNPRWGPDNWIYGVSGAGSDGTIRGPRLVTPVTIGAVCFRFRADGSAFEPVSGRTHGFGQAIDDWGDRFLCTNQQHALHVIPIEHRYLARNPYYAAPDLVRNISTYGHPARVFPTSRPDPWRRARAADPAWVRFYGEMEATANGYFTAASGQTIYGSDRFPQEFQGNHFSVDNAQNLIHRCLLTPDGVSYRVSRPRADEQTEFLTSTEQWFRPVNLLTGPDGAMYVVDMYRDIIEDYSAIPRYLQQQYIRSLIAGAKHGRIWRIVADGRPQPENRNLAALSTEELIDCLADPNRWRRTTAQRLLVERGDGSCATHLADLVRAGSSPQARMHALCALDGLGELTTETLAASLEDEHFAVRMHAIRLAEGTLNQSAELLARIQAMAADPHPRVLLQVALSLGESDSPNVAEALTKLAIRHGDDPWIAVAILTSSIETADAVVAAIVQHRGEPNHGGNMLHALASIVGARRDAAQIGRVLSTTASLTDETATDTQRKILNGLVEGLERGRASAVDSPATIAALQRLLASSDDRIRSLALQIAQLVRLHSTTEMQAIFQDARRAAVDEQRPTADRLSALAILSAAPFDDWKADVPLVLDARQPVEIQLAAVQAAAVSDHAEVPSVLLKGFLRYSPAVSAAIVDATFARQDRLPALLAVIERGEAPRSAIDAIRREQLINSRQAEIASKARELFSAESGSPDRQPVLEQYRTALQMERDAKRGRAVFDKQCSKCHKLGDVGFEVGPDLLTAKTRADETLISDVLDPSNQITVGYNQYTVITVDGKIFTGVLAAETATSVTLRAEERKDTIILRKDIDELAASKISMMPQDLEKEVSPQDLADLLGFLRQTLGSQIPSTMVLFDDEATFLEQLNEGDGRLRLERADRLTGNASLAVTPPQRFSPRIDGWQYRIVENPGPGEYRYLRFAWKQPRGDGVMLELAANGTWPPAGETRQRYYAGNNTTGWAAVQVNEQRPQDWTIVTCDLWKDCGEFTLTGLAPTAMGGEALFDRIELLRNVQPVP